MGAGRDKQESRCYQHEQGEQSLTQCFHLCDRKSGACTKLFDIGGHLNLPIGESSKMEILGYCHDTAPL